MSNFFTNNPDLMFNFEHGRLEEIAALQEEGYEDDCDFAPADAADAVDNYRRVLEVIGDLSANFIAPRAEDVDRQGNTLNDDGSVTYPKGLQENLDALTKADVMGMTLPRKYGGLNFPCTVYTMATEVVSRADASLMNLFGLQGIAETIWAFADDRLCDKYLPKFARGEVTGAMVLTEPDAGSDLRAVKVTAADAGDGTWRLNGVKRFITNGCGDVLLVLARSEPDREGGLGLSLFLCDRQEGLRVRRLEDKLGIHGSPTCELEFHDAVGYLIGERQRGLVTYVMALMNGARVGIAAQALGIAEAAYAEAREYAYTRQQFDRRIERFPAVSDMLVTMRVRIETARALLYETTRVVDRHLACLRKLEEDNFPDKDAQRATKRTEKRLKRVAGLLTPISKYRCCEMVNTVAYDAIQVLGGSGYMRDYAVERHYRDARITNIYEGTSQLQIVGAIGGVLAGTADKHLDQLAQPVADPPRGTRGLLAKVGRMRLMLADAVTLMRARGDQSYTDLCARTLVDIAADTMTGYLFIDASRHSKRRLVLAKRFVTEVFERTKSSFARVKSGEASSVQNFDLIAGPPTVED